MNTDPKHESPPLLRSRDRLPDVRGTADLMRQVLTAIDELRRGQDELLHVLLELGGRPRSSVRDGAVRRGASPKGGRSSRGVQGG